MAYYMPHVCRRLSYEFDEENPEVIDPPHIVVDVNNEYVVISTDSEDDDDISFDLEANNIDDNQDPVLHMFGLDGLYNDIRCVLIAFLIHM
jgi:hypothetical protein